MLYQSKCQCSPTHTVVRDLFKMSNTQRLCPGLSPIVYYLMLFVAKIDRDGVYSYSSDDTRHGDRELTPKNLADNIKRAIDYLSTHDPDIINFGGASPRKDALVLFLIAHRDDALANSPYVLQIVDAIMYDYDGYADDTRSFLEEILGERDWHAPERHLFEEIANISDEYRFPQLIMKAATYWTSALRTSSTNAGQKIPNNDLRKFRMTLARLLHDALFKADSTTKECMLFSNRVAFSYELMEAAEVAKIDLALFPPELVVKITSTGDLQGVFFRCGFYPTDWTTL